MKASPAGLLAAVAFLLAGPLSSTRATDWAPPIFEGVATVTTALPGGLSNLARFEARAQTTFQWETPDYPHGMIGGTVYLRSHVNILLEPTAVPTTFGDVASTVLLLTPKSTDRYVLKNAAGEELAATITTSGDYTTVTYRIPEVTTTNYTGPITSVVLRFATNGQPLFSSIPPRIVAPFPPEPEPTPTPEATPTPSASPTPGVTSPAQPQPRPKPNRPRRDRDRDRARR